MIYLKFFYHVCQVLPELLQLIRGCDDGLKEFILWKLGTLVSIVCQVNKVSL